MDVIDNMDKSLEDRRVIGGLGGGDLGDQVTSRLSRYFKAIRNLAKLTPDHPKGRLRCCPGPVLPFTLIRVLLLPRLIMSLETAIEVIDTFLHGRLRDTGVSGFEGLIAVLFQQATGQEFRLSSSGRQSGRDAGSESGYANSIKIEAKHYREKTALNLRELIAEIDQAAESDKNLDIWVLAASRSVDDQIATSLDAHAETYGIEIVLLDLGINGLPRLAVLMAAFTDVVIDWANRHQLQYNASEVRSALVTVADAPEFEPAKSRLLVKLLGTIGYDSALRRIHDQLFTTLSDKRTAQGVFRQSLGIRAPDAQVVRRTGLNMQLDEWWDVTGFPRPAVVLGEEGTGKTWAVFDWVIGRIGR